MPFGKRHHTLADALLHFFKDLAGNDGFMVVTNEVLRQFTEVGAVDLAEMVNAILLLQKQVALVFFIAQDRFDDALMTFSMTAPPSPLYSLCYLLIAR